MKGTTTTMMTGTRPGNTLSILSSDARERNQTMNTMFLDQKLHHGWRRIAVSKQTSYDADVDADTCIFGDGLSNLAFPEI